MADVQGYLSTYPYPCGKTVNQCVVLGLVALLGMTTAVRSEPSLAQAPTSTLAERTDQPLTPLLACFYLNQMIQERQGAGGILPDSVPRLMLSHLAQINRTVESAQQRQDPAVQRDAQAVAWACLENTYRPSWITKETAIAALARVDNGAVEERFHYLRDRLSFLQPSDPGDRLAQYTGKPYRLPSEAEWEYACRAGTNTPW